MAEIPYEEKSKEEVSKFFKLKGQLERFSQNYRIQGSGATMSKLAAILFEEEIKKKYSLKDIYIVNMVHDEIVVQSKKEYAEDAKRILEESMIKAGAYICKTIPMKVDSFIGDNWGCKA